MVWITCGLLWCFYQLFGHLFWWQKFNAEDPLMSKRIVILCHKKEKHRTCAPLMLWKIMGYQNMLYSWKGHQHFSKICRSTILLFCGWFPRQLALNSQQTHNLNIVIKSSTVTLRNHSKVEIHYTSWQILALGRFSQRSSCTSLKKNAFFFSEVFAPSNSFSIIDTY